MKPWFWTKLAMVLALALLASPSWAQGGDQAPAAVRSDQPPADLPPAPSLTNAYYIEQPAMGDYARLFPRRALSRHVDGSVGLDCLVGEDGHLTCAIVSETPQGYGFGAASLEIVRIFRAAPVTRDGAPTAGGRVSRTIVWRQ